MNYELVFVGIGALITLLILMFIGWVDVVIMNKPITEPRLAYVVSSACVVVLFLRILLFLEIDD